MNFQRDANLWFVEELESLDAVGTHQTIAFGETAPADPTVGKLWYDTSDLEMSIWYVDPTDTGVQGQWVPLTASYTFTEAFSALTATINTETANRTTAILALNNILTAIKNAVTVSTDFASLKSGLLSALSTV